MNIIKLAIAFENKYKIGQMSEEAIKASIDQDLDMIVLYARDKFPIIAELGSLSLKGRPIGAWERMAKAGYNFISFIYSKIEELEDRDNLNVKQITNILSDIYSAIEGNKHLAFSEKGNIEEGVEEPRQFRHVHALVHFKREQSGTAGRKPERRVRNVEEGKINTGLTRIQGLCKQVLNKLGASVEDIKYEKPQRAPISDLDIKDFLLQYGDDYSLNKELWRDLIESNPHAKEVLTTVINAVNRGRLTYDDAQIRLILKKLKENYYERMRTNLNYLESGETLAPSTSTSVSPERTSLFNPYYSGYKK